MVSSSVQGALVLASAAKFAAFGGGWVMASDAVLRGMRALTLPFVLFATGLAGHAAAGGVTPDASLLVPMFLLTVFAVVPFAGAPISPACSAGKDFCMRLCSCSAERGLRPQQPGAARAPAYRRRPVLIS